jgi:2-keto-4-pentenoate hydratase
MATRAHTEPLLLDSIAREMMTAQDECRQIAPFTSRLAGFDNETAYEVARFIHGERMKAGFVPVGRKLGFTNPVLWDRYGVREPIWAHVYDRTVVMSSGAPANCILARFAEPKNEPQIVVHIRSSLVYTKHSPPD